MTNPYYRLPSQVRAPLHALKHEGPLPLIRRATVRFTDASVRNMPYRLRALHDAYRGQRCFIMGNGPSLNKMDLELLKHEYVWGANKVYLLFDRISWRPPFYVAMDRRVVPDISRDIKTLAHQLPNTRFFFPSLFRENRVLESRSNIYWYRELQLDTSDIPFATFSIDASKGVSSARTVTIASLQLAVWLGFSPIYLIGCDTTYVVPPTVQFEDNDSHKLVSTQNDDLNHFDNRYFGIGSKWHDPRVDKMILHYSWAKQVCDSIGVEIYNATVGGALEVFPRADYNNLFEEL